MKTREIAQLVSEAMGSGGIPVDRVQFGGVGDMVGAPVADTVRGGGRGLSGYCSDARGVERRGRGPTVTRWW